MNTSQIDSDIIQEISSNTLYEEDVIVDSLMMMALNIKHQPTRNKEGYLGTFA